jgi:transcriptional regulator with XRE-family HTH domain
MTTRNNLRQLRDILALTQPQLASLAGCSMDLIHSVETGRARLSTKVANQISRRTGISDAWLTGDLQAPMVALDGKPYTLETFQQRQLDYHFSEGPHYRWREVQLGETFDLLHRLLRAWQSQGKVKDFMKRVEDFMKAELDEHPEIVRLADAIYGERRRAQEAARKAGRVIPLGLLTPLGVESLKRGRVRLAQAIAAMTAATSSSGGKKRKK